jgi:flavin reductase (DIM6/NTAB) family NADH-FMN oxidoreductase RutF
VGTAPRPQNACIDNEEAVHMSHELQTPPLPPDLFRSAMRRLAATVTIVSTVDGCGRRGMTATSVVPVSMEPLSLLVAVNRTAAMHAPMCAATAFCINVLRGDQQDLASVFGSSGRWMERFVGDDWEEDAHGVPYLRHAQANLFCRRSVCWEYGTHSIFVGDVDRILVAEDVDPLLYADGRYRQLNQPMVAGAGG